MSSLATPTDLIPRLIDLDAENVASLYLPLRRAWNRDDLFQRELRALLNEVTADAERYGAEPTVIQAKMESATNVVRHPDAISPHADGLALILHSGEVVVESLPFAPALHASIDRFVALRPVWPHVHPDRPFYVAALSAGGVALFIGSRYEISRANLGDNVTTTLETFRKFDDPVRSLRYHTGTPARGTGGTGRRAAMYFGHEDAGDRAYRVEAMTQFLRYIDNEIRRVIEQDVPLHPLLLAGPDHLRGIYRSVNGYEHLHDEEIDGSHRTGGDRVWDVAALQKAAWQIIEEDLTQEREEALDRYRQDVGRSAHSTAPVLRAAVSGRVDTLFVAANAAPVWGRIEDTGGVNTRARRASGDSDLLNAALIHTARAGGTIYAFDDAVPVFDRTNNQPVMAARFRY